MGARVVFRDGPYRLIRRADGRPNIYIHATVGARRYRISTATDNVVRAKRKLADFVAEMESGYRNPAASGESWETVVKALVGRTRWRARSRGIPFSITAQHVYAMLAGADFRCTISGIALSKPARHALEKDPWSPSLDRIDCRMGYEPDNVRVVALIANYAMNQWGFDALLRLSLAVVRNSERARRAEEIVTVSLDLPGPRAQGSAA